MTNILCINGGGVRGIIPYILLQQIYNKDKAIFDYFDIYSGSSVGAVICCLLLVSDNKKDRKYNINNISDLLINMLLDIFKINWYSYITSVNGYLCSPYSDEKIMNSLKILFGDYTLNDLIKPVIIPSYDIIRDEPIVFNQKEHGHLKIVDVLRATIAAPTYLNPYKMNINGIDYIFIDGGVVVNDTSLLCINYLTNNKICTIDKIKILNLETGTIIKKNEIQNFNYIYWVKNIINILYMATYKKEIKECITLLNNKFLQLNPIIDEKYYKLTDITNFNYYINTSITYFDDDIYKKYLNWVNS